MSTGHRHSDRDSASLATPVISTALGAWLRQASRVCATRMCVGGEAWRVVLLIGSGVVASGQIDKPIISMPLVRDDLTVGLDLTGLIVAFFAPLGAVMEIGARTLGRSPRLAGRAGARGAGGFDRVCQRPRPPPHPRGRPIQVREGIWKPCSPVWPLRCSLLRRPLPLPRSRPPIAIAIRRSPTRYDATAAPT